MKCQEVVMCDWCVHHKFHGPQFDNSNRVKFVFHRFIWDRHGCHAHCLDTNVICLFVLFKHECCMFIHVVYT
jgi:hypothetical protein